MATNPLTAAIMQGMDPGVYRPLSDIQTGDALISNGLDSSPTSGWGALGRLAQALAGTYLSSSATSDLAKTIGAGKKAAQDQLMAAIEASQRPVPSATPQTAPLTPPVQQATPAPQASSVPVEPGSPNAQVAARFPAEMSPQTPNQAVAARFPADMSPPPAPSPTALAATPAASEGVAAINAAIAPRGIRNNNALNIEDGPFARSQPGYAGSDGRFARFATPEQGAAAANALLDSYQNNHGLNTVAGIVGRWAPSSDGNNVSAYASDVAGRLGIDPNAPIPPEMRPALIAAMARHENGMAAPGTAGAPVQLAQANIRPGVESDAAPAESRAASGGIDVHRLLAVLQNPYSDDTTKAVAQKLLLQQLTPTEDTYGVTGEDALGNKRYGFINTKEHTINGQPADTAAGAKQPGGLFDNIDSTKTGKQYLAQFPPEIQASVMDYLNGQKMPTGNPRRQDVVRTIASKVGAEIGLPADDAAFAERRKMRTDMGSSSPTSLGGILSNGKSAFNHLADASDRMSALGNYNGPNVPGGAYIGAAGNYVGNTVGATPDTAAKITGITDNLMKYGQEGTKFYAGTGGGEGERMAAVRAMDPTQASSKQMAEFLETEKGLMLDRLTQKENQVRSTLGQDYLDKHPVRTPDVEENIKRIDANIAKLGGSQSGTTAAPSAAAATGAASPDRAAVEAEMRKRGLIQ